MKPVCRVCGTRISACARRSGDRFAARLRDQQGNGAGRRPDPGYVLKCESRRASVCVSCAFWRLRRHWLWACFAAPLARARGRCRQCAHRRGGDRPHRRARAPAHRNRPHPGVDRAGPGRHHPPHRSARPRVEHQLGDLCALQFRRRADRPADRDPALSHGGFGTVLARSRIVARGRHHAEFGRAPRPAGFRGRGYFPHHARSRHRHHLRRRIAHRQAAAALSVGAGRLQRQDQFVHALLRHRHRHRRIAGVVPDHSVRGEGQRDVPGRRRARLGRARLYRHRFRFLGQGVRHVGGRRAHLARDRRSDPGRDTARVPVRLSQSEPLACALRAYHHRLARRSGRR